MLFIYFLFNFLVFILFPSLTILLKLGFTSFYDILEWFHHFIAGNHDVVLRKLLDSFRIWFTSWNLTQLLCRSYPFCLSLFPIFPLPSLLYFYRSDHIPSPVESFHDKYRSLTQICILKSMISIWVTFETFLKFATYTSKSFWCLFSLKLWKYLQAFLGARMCMCVYIKHMKIQNIYLWILCWMHFH